MAASIQDYKLPHDTHKLYDVILDTHLVHTLVTHTPDIVDRWIADMPEDITVVGLDVEWRPNSIPKSENPSENPVATLQLCVGHTCLIFQIFHALSIPQSLAHFLSSARHTFVGVGIEGDVEKLYYDYGLSVRNPVDLRDLAAAKLMRSDLKKVGLKRLAMDVLRKEIDKPPMVTRSRWDNRWLTPDQVQYACLDAFISYLIGKELYDGVQKQNEPVVGYTGYARCLGSFLTIIGWALGMWLIWGISYVEGD